MEANGIQGEREYFGLLSPTAEPQPVRKLYHKLVNLPIREVIYKNYDSLHLQHWLVLTKPLKKQLPGSYMNSRHCTTVYMLFNSARPHSHYRIVFFNKLILRLPHTCRQTALYSESSRVHVPSRSPKYHSAKYKVTTSFMRVKALGTR